MYNLILSSVLCILILWIPESPRFYYSNKNYDEARQILTFIGRTNGKLDKDEQYDQKFVDE